MSALNGLYLARSLAEQSRYGDQARRGKLRRVAPRIYVDREADEMALIRRYILDILAFRHADAVLAYRSAVTLQPGQDEIWLIDDRNPGSQRNDQIGPVTMHLMGGNTHLGVHPLTPHLHVMSLERVLLESLTPRHGRGLDKYLTPEECEDQLLKVLARGERFVNELRDRARALASPLGLEAAFERLSTIISALLQTHEAEGVLTSESARAQARGEPFDEACLARCETLYHYLTNLRFPDHPETYAKTPWRTIAFFEAYFSNYIEGTEMTVEEAEGVVFQGRDLPQRPGDTHDVRGTFEICSDYTEMCVTPGSADEFLALLQDRHRVILGGRPDQAPGEFKTRVNQAGSTVFVRPNEVKGTLRRGFGLYTSLPSGMRRALFLHFLITDVHPMSDGNGRLARLMMSAELVSTGQAKIIVPTAARDDYLNGQRLASRERKFRVMCKVLAELHGYTASLPTHAYADVLARLEEDHATRPPDEGLPRFARPVRFRFEPETPAGGPTP